MSANSANPEPQSVPEQMRVRREKRQRILDEGREVYPVALPVTATISEVREKYGHLEADSKTDAKVGVAGRVVYLRNTGKLCFVTLQEGTGAKLQVMLSQAEVGAGSLAAFKADVDLGDHMFAHGLVISSRRGELSVFADEWALAAKALRPLPVLHKESSEESRSAVLTPPSAIRREMVAPAADAVAAESFHWGFIERPDAVNLHGCGCPFKTHINASDIDEHLRIA